MRRFASIGVVLTGVVGFSLAGCESPAPVKAARDATGVVKIEGLPVGGVYVYLHPLESGGRTPYGSKTETDGTFAVPVYGPGAYAVTVTWPVVTVVQGEAIEGDDRFKGRYQNPNNPVLKVTIQEGDNALPPINLKRP